MGGGTQPTTRKNMLTILHVLIDWLVLDEQMNKTWPFFILANEQNWLGVVQTSQLKSCMDEFPWIFPTKLAPEDGFLILAQGMGIDKSYVTPVQLEVCFCRGFQASPKMVKKKEGIPGIQTKKTARFLQMSIIFRNLTQMFDVFDSNPRGQWMIGVGEDRNFHEVSTFCEVPWKQVTRVVLSIFSLLYIATGAIYAAEHDVNPQFPDFFTVSLAEGQTQHHIQVTTGNQSQLRVWQFLNAHIKDGFGNSSVHAAEWLSHVGWFPLSHITLQFHPFPQPPQLCATCDVYGPCMAA